MKDRYFGGERFGIATTGCPSYYNYSEHRNEVIAGDDIDIVAHHSGYVGIENQRHPTGKRLLEYRANKLVSYIQESTELLALGKVEESLIVAFERLDKELKAILEEEGCPPFTASAEELWKTRYNSLVVVVDKKHEQVHVSGSGQLHVLVVKPGDGEYETTTLTTTLHNDVVEYNRQMQHRPDDVDFDVLGIATEWIENEQIRIPRKVDRHHQLYFYKKVDLEPEHDHVILASESYIRRPLYFRTSLYGFTSTPITDLPDYFDPVGFEKVIRDVVFQCGHADRAPTLLVLCIDEHKHSGVKRRLDIGASHSCEEKRLKVCEDGEGAGTWLSPAEAEAA